MMRINQNGSPLNRILVLSNTLEIPIRVFAGHEDAEALEYANEGDSILYMYSDGGRCSTVRGAKSGTKLGSDIADSMLCTDVIPDKRDLLEMCFHEDKELAKGFISKLVGYVLESHEARGGL
jgi:hypothetical protein